jgi:hypothetical protein
MLALWLELTPLWILLGILLLFASFALLARVQNGRYVRPIVATLARVPIFRRLMTKASTAALERQNPDLASALKKLQRFGNLNDPRRAQQAMSTLTAAERRAYIAASGEQADQVGAGQTLNREQRRRLEKARRDAERGR